MSRAGRLLESRENARLGTARHRRGGCTLLGTAPHGPRGGCAPLGTARPRGPAPRPEPLGSAPGFVRAGTPGSGGRPRGSGPDPPSPPRCRQPGGRTVPKPPPAAPGESFCSGRTGGSGRGPRSAPPWPPRSVTAAPRAAPPAAPCPGHGARSPGGAAGSERCPAAPSRLRPGGGGRCPPAARGCPGGHQWSGSGSLRPPVMARGKFPPYEPTVTDSAAEPAPVVTPPVPGPPGGGPGTTCTPGPGGARGTAGLQPLQLWAGGWRVKTGPWGSPGLPREVADGGGSGCSPQPGPAPRSLQLDGCCSSLELK